MSQQKPLRDLTALNNSAKHHEGFAVMYLHDEKVLVDLHLLDFGSGTRAVVIGWDETIAIQDMSEARSHRRFLGDRSFTIPDPTNLKTGRRAVWVVGRIVASRPVVAS